ncbi:GNAT family N-acetyltransferase [Agromyces seonyuensis]|uniref:GNAT family N-acetyltransferase n=1 Tax=Agromyces seonyuensis TaxID=2662446 RepID=A0A6I4P6K9_9MICO|nr:GNAT family N-acetyltransferase [Agromyces seonyuensis]MWC00260.1 GNAT family N-acetyltransferase [Agromyces seonyuensis]
MEAVSIRQAVPSDGPFLADMVVEAANWRPEIARPRVSILGDPVYASYISGWQRPADRGVVAMSADGEAIGAAWYRIFPADAPVHGHVERGVPELIIGVRPMWRAQGVGRALLRRLIVEAGAAGYARIGLSVEHGNFAQGLYRAEGFEHHVDTGDRDTMVRILR